MPAEITRFLRSIKRIARVTSTAWRNFLSEITYLSAIHDNPIDKQTPLSDLDASAPRLRELRHRYMNVRDGVTAHVLWGSTAVSQISNTLQNFRGDSPFIWHYREAPRATSLKYFVFLKYVQERDNFGLLNHLIEDGAFGCWRFQYVDQPTVSRDLLDSVNEILFLNRSLNLFERKNLRLLDIGAGYGRLAHRILEAAPNVIDYCCTDAVPESAFLCEFYLTYRGLLPRGRVVHLDEVKTQLHPGDFDIAINIHSFSECSISAIAWWVSEINRLQIPTIVIVPNHEDKFLSIEKNGDRIDFFPLLEKAGYKISHKEKVISEKAVSDILLIKNTFFILQRETN